jgi:hypothetical protein
LEAWIAAREETEEDVAIFFRASSKARPFSDDDVGSIFMLKGYHFPTARRAIIGCYYLFKSFRFNGKRLD